MENDPGDYSFATRPIGHIKLPVELPALCGSTYLSVGRRVITESDFGIQYVVVCVSLIWDRKLLDDNTILYSRLMGLTVWNIVDPLTVNRAGAVVCMRYPTLALAGKRVGES